LGDVIEVVFDQDTNEVSVATKDDLDDILDLSTPLGTSYNGEWTTPSTLTITPTNVAHAGGESLTKVGVFTVGVVSNSGIFSSDLSSVETSSDATLSGSWGDRETPTISTVTTLNLVQTITTKCSIGNETIAAGGLKLSLFFGGSSATCNGSVFQLLG